MAIKRYRKGDDQKIATNFRAREFDCKGNGCCNTTIIDEKLVEYLQQIRTHFGKPVYVTAYRCKTHNAKVANAAPNSYHIYGQAADIHIDGVAPAEIAKYAESIGVLGIGLYETEKDGYFVHIDTRTSKSFWIGHNQKRVSTFGAEKVEEEYTLFDFVWDVQNAIGAVVDGIAGKETLSKTPTVSRWWNRKHKVVVAIQKRLLALGYEEVGSADGTAGAKFDKALKAFQKDNGCVADGEATAKKQTWKKLLEME